MFCPWNWSLPQVLNYLENGLPPELGTCSQGSQLTQANICNYLLNPCTLAIHFTQRNIIFFLIYLHIFGYYLWPWSYVPVDYYFLNPDFLDCQKNLKKQKASLETFWLKNPVFWRWNCQFYRILCKEKKSRVKPQKESLHVSWNGRGFLWVGLNGLVSQSS